MAGDQRPRSTSSCGGSFNPRPHMAGDLAEIQPPREQVMFQSTPAHGGRRDVNLDIGVRALVSIHARTWRATKGGMAYVEAFLVSIHARTWRATRTRQHSNSSRLFQSTPAHGGRPGANGIIGVLSVSIHARTWRATIGPCKSRRQRMFQSTPAHGGRRRRFADRGHADTVSIHARTWRATGQMRRSANPATCFNPRPHMAGDRLRPSSPGRSI